MLKALLGRWGRPPDDARLQEAHALFDAGNFSAASDIYSELARRDPSPELFVNDGYARFMLGDRVAASAAFERALSLRPVFAPALVGLGDVAARANDHAAALQCYDRALASDPALAVAHGNRAQSLFALGRTAEAWAEEECRHAAPGAAALYPHRYDRPRWDGGAVVGRLLVHWEQGFGDILQHLRFLPLLEARGIDFVFECPPPLLRLALRSLPAGRVVAAREVPADVDGIAAIAGLLSLPHRLGVDAAALPSPPYVRFDAARRDAMRAAWRRDHARLIGIAWRASAFDAARHASLGDFIAALKAVDEGRQHAVRWVSLQKDATPDEAAQLAGAGAVDVSAQLVDFADTADAIAALDGVISVDTAVAHLTGALDRPLSLLLNEPAAVRWMLDREDSPWYPSARLFRKPSTAPWAPAIARALSHLVS